MGDAAAASSPATPTSILICREDGNDIFPGADFSVFGDDRLLAVDQDDEYFAVLLSKERASADAGAPIEEWMKASRSGRVRWIIKVVRALFPLFCPVHIFLAEKFDLSCSPEEFIVIWCLQTTALFRFGGKTAYVAVTYFDRFLAQRKVDVGDAPLLLPLPVSLLFSM
jgi:cyclin D5, plant